MSEINFTTDVICEVCEAEPAVVVAAVPGVPYSAAYGVDCLRADAHPYWIVIVNTALVGGYFKSAEWWQEIVDRTLARLCKSRVQFDADVTMEMEALDEMGGGMTGGFPLQSPSQG